MRYLKTIIKFEGDLKTMMAQTIKQVLISSGYKVIWTDSHELTVIHKRGRKEEGK